MRFSTLDLTAFGHFSNETLTFTPRSGVVDVVYGDNEAGKSTSLRAIGSFLYGIPARTTDDFVHPMPTLRVGATVVGADGRGASCIRRKGLKDTLRDLNDVPIDPGFLGQMLGGLDRDMFEQMYALSRGQLERGATDLLTGNGALGEALFGASLGLAGINDVLRDLETDAAEIFKPNGHNPKLNSLLADLDAVRKRARDAEVRPADYHDLQKALDYALEEREQLDVDLAHIEADILRARRNQKLIPLAARRGQLVAELEKYRDAPILADTAREERVSAERELAAAADAIERGERKTDELRATLKTLVPRTQLLARATQIRDLHKNISAHQKAARDLPAIKATYSRAIEEAEVLLRETHPTRALHDVEDLRPSGVSRATINELSDEHVRLTEAKRTTGKSLDDERRALARAQAELESLPAPDDITTLRVALEAARKLGEIDEQLAADEANLTALEEQLAAEMTSLGFAGSPFDLEALPVPSDVTVTRFVKAEERLHGDRTAIGAEIRSVEGRLRDERQALSALDLAGAVPTEADLEETRGRREGRWRVVRSTLADDATADPESTATVAGAYEESVRDADEIADRLRREADRVATKASLEAAISSCERELEALAAQLTGLDAAAAELDNEWRSLWQRTGVTPQTAAEMREWLVSRARIVESAKSSRADRARFEGRLATVAHRRAALATALDKLGRSVADDASLAETTAIADEVVSDHTARAAALRSAHDRVTDAKHREREAAEAGVAARTDLNDWQVRWLAEVTKLGVDPDLKPDLVRRVIDAVEEMFVQLAAAAKDKARIDGIERDTRVFNAAVATLVADVAPELADLAEDQAVAQLHQVLDAAQNDATQAELIELQLTELKVSLEETDERQHTVGHELERLMKDARCSTTDDLAAAEEHSAAVLRVRGDLAAIEEQMTLLAASSPDEIAAEVHAVDLNLIEAELQQLGQRKGDLSRRHKEVGEEVGEKRALLDRICGGDDAAQLHAEAESIKAEIRTYAERYAQLRLASAILRQQIDDFRERSHGPLLTRAGHFFSKLTCGGCIGLATGFDGKGNVVLLGRRKNGREITVEQMSTGSRDQLYLGLRLATLEQQAERGDPLPLIVDDLFEGYDDKRAAAGFEALAELAEKTQIIFFTHHRHLVEIAQQTLSAERCVVQELGERLAASAEAA